VVSYPDSFQSHQAHLTMLQYNMHVFTGQMTQPIVNTRHKEI